MREGPAGGVSSLFSTEALLDYIMICCQVKYGGLRDKPGKGRDFYHTCYCLSGLAASQRLFGDAGPAVVYGDAGNLLEATHPVYNVRVDKVARAFAHFGALPTGHAVLTGAAP